MFFPANTLSS